MDARLERFLAGSKPVASTRTAWLKGRIELDVESYLHAELPPPALISSARRLVCTPKGIAVFHNESGAHILPGGRLEPAESCLEAFRREALEEVGCQVGEVALVGFIRFRHRTPRPAGWGRYPYPDFLHVVYVARAERVVIDAPADREVQRLEFLAPDAAGALPIADAERAFLAPVLELLLQLT